MRLLIYPVHGFPCFTCFTYSSPTGFSESNQLFPFVFFQSAKFSILRQNCQRMRIGEGGSQPDTFWTHFKVSIKLEALLGPKNYWQLRNLCIRVGVCVWENFHFSFFFFELNSLPKVEAEPRYIMAIMEHMTFLRLKALVSWLLWSNWDVDVAGTHIKFPTCLEGQQTW